MTEDERHGTDGQPTPGHGVESCRRGLNVDEPGFESEWSTTRYDWSDGMLPSTAVVKAVAAVTGRTPTALPPLCDHIDSDALDDLVAREDGEAVRVSFSYAGVAVVVTGSGTVAVRADGK